MTTWMHKKHMKHDTNQHYSESNFEVGHWVSIMIQPHKHMSLKQQNKDNKLVPNYYGPYKVSQKIDNVDYKLELPPSSRFDP